MDVNTIRCFISYTHQDHTLVHRIASDLRALGLDIWLDEWEIRPGESITDKVQHGLRQYDVLLAMLSRNALASPWVGEELKVAYRRRAYDQRMIIPVLLEDVGDAMPAFLGDYKYVTFQDAESYDTSLGKLADSILLDSQLQTADAGGMQVLNHVISVSVRLRGNNFETAEFVVNRVVVPRVADWHVTFEMAPEGRITSAATRGVSLERAPLRRGSEQWMVYPTNPVFVGRPVEFTVAWTLEDEYAEEGSPSWYYALDSPTRELTLELLFDRSNDPPHLRCELRRTVAVVDAVDVARSVEDDLVRYRVERRYATPGYRYQFIWSRLNE